MNSKSIHLKILAVILIFFPLVINAQCFLTGADLSYTNEILKNGGVYYSQNGEAIEPYGYFAERGAKIVRLRLWHTPQNNPDHCGQPIEASSLEDVLDAAQKVKTNGMQLKLSIHYSDYFVDPGKQQMPKAWKGLSHDLLLDSIADYTYRVLERFRAQNTLPDIVSIGNETTWGFIDDTETTDGFDWTRDVDKFNVALTTVDAFNQTYGTQIKKAIHLTESSVLWAVDAFVENGIDNYDIIGVSYYPFFSPDTDLTKVGEIIDELYTTYQKEVMIFETGYAGTNGFSDNYNNFISNNGNVLPYPATPKGQKDFLMDLVKTIDENNGSGLIYWEPAWITSNLCDRWGQGSSYENVTFFDTENNQPLPAFEFFSYCGTSLIGNQRITLSPSIYPNPLRSSKMIIENVPDDCTWHLYDTEGNLVQSGVLKNRVNSYTITLEDHQAGVYFLTLSSASQRDIFIKKLILL